MGITDALEEVQTPETQTKDIPAPREEAVEDIMDLEQQLRGLRIPKRIRPEWIMAAIAAAAALVLIVMIALSRPYLQPQEEDPQALQQFHQNNFEPLQVTERPEEEDPADPTEETEDNYIPTIPPDTNPFGPHDFQYDRHNYLYLQNMESYAGVDVSAYQGDINWSKVKNSGIDFAIIRLGYRGYESGKLVKDEYAAVNLEGARKAGLRVGAYFFSQALNIKEVDQEIEFILKVLDGFELDMPIVLDWEIPAASARTAKMDKQTLTDIQLHFCGQMRDRGFQPMIYFNWHQSEHLYDLHSLEAYPFWLALYQERMTYPWKVEMWQYTATGRVPGIQGDVDLNVYMPD